MLPVGHIAAGYLVGEALLKFVHPPLPAEQARQLLAWAMFCGFMPDLDMFYFFIKHKTFLVAADDASRDPHRKFISHEPVWWLLAGLLVYFSARSFYWKYAGLLLWLGSWSHFILDSIEYGIPWLAPFSKKLYALKNPEYKSVVKERHFIKHTAAFLKTYGRRLTFYLEILIIVSAIIIGIKY